ncbi:MAG: hypothetical protein RR756_01295 [Cetobacterium sp.]
MIGLVKETISKFYTYITTSPFKENGVYNFISFLSLAILIYFRILDSRKIVSEKKLQKKSYWFRQHILKENLSYLTNHFKNLSKLIEMIFNSDSDLKNKKSVELKDIGFKLTDEFTALKSFDICFYNFLLANINNYIILLLRCNSEYEAKGLLEEYKDFIYKEIYTYEVNDYKKYSLFYKNYYYLKNFFYNKFTFIFSTSIILNIFFINIIIYLIKN